MGAIAVHTSYDKGLVTLPALLSATFLQTPRFSYATEEALIFICEQLFSDAVSALRKVRVLINYNCRSNIEPKHARKHETHPPRVK